MTRTCASCGESFEASRSTKRFCGSTCRSRAARSAKPATVAPAENESELCAAIRQQLEAAGKVDSFLGRQALVLAERLGYQGDTGSAKASLSKELRAVMDAVLADAPKVADEVDELEERRRRKASGA